MAVSQRPDFWMMALGDDLAAAFPRGFLNIEILS